jgi:hypothetical protein
MVGHAAFTAAAAKKLFSVAGWLFPSSTCARQRRRRHNDPVTEPSQLALPDMS